MAENNIIDSRKSEEIVLFRPITEKDIQSFNEMSPIIITLRNTRKQDPNIISKLNKNVSIRIIGGYDEKASQEYKNEEFHKKTMYSPEEISKVIQSIEEIEKDINSKWSDLEKATFIYVELMKRIAPNTDSKNIGNKPLVSLINEKADSLEYAFIYKEILERNGIACRFVQNEKGYGWNEVLIDGEYYPADLYLDSKFNEPTIKNIGYELKNFLSNKEFYEQKEHKTSQFRINERNNATALDHSNIQKAIDYVYHPEKHPEDIIPQINLKSKELQTIFENSEIKSENNLQKKKEIKLSIDSSNIISIRDDIREIGKYYPQAIENITLSNESSTPINMQELVDAIYESKGGSDNITKSPTQITIESSNPEDFDLDFSKAPTVDTSDRPKIEDDSHSQKISFVNTSNSAIKLPNLNGKIPDNIETIRIQDCDVSDFDISSDKVVGPRTGVLRNVRRLELVGGNTCGINNLRGLDDVISLSVSGLSESDFNDVMNLAIKGSTKMPKLFELIVKNQNLKNRSFFSEIHNPNIVELKVFNSNLNNITGFENIKNQLVFLSVQYNLLSIDDMKKISDAVSNNSILRTSFYGNNSLWNTIDKLSNNVLSDDTYNYLESYFNRSGFVNYTDMKFGSHINLDDKKKEMLKDFSRWDLEKVPYFIEDAEVFRKILPYTNNPIMIKDLRTFENYLNTPDYFEKDYLQDGKIWLTKEQLEYLINSRKTIQQKICLKINTVSELSTDGLENFRNECNNKGLNLVGINVFDDRCIENSSTHNFDEIDTHLETYELDEYKQIRESLDEVTSGITSSMSDLEKFCVIYHRLSEKINEYDHQIASDTYSKEHAIYQAKLLNKSRNLSQGLIRQTGFDINNNRENPTLGYRSVCAGYADILKNALEMVGINALIDTGNALENRTKGKHGGHEWNKIKIDGKWYYTDLTWDAEKKTHNWALRGADKFVDSNDIRTMDGERTKVNCHFTDVTPGSRNEQMEWDDYDRALLNDTFNKVKNGELPPKSKYKINIPDDPDLSTPQINVDKIKQEYINRKNDMIAKYYGDREYRNRYNEIARRYRENEVEVTNGGITYRTVQDYAERQDDEKFLILGEYKESLERSSRYEAGDTSVYSGSPDQIRDQYERDREYVTTRNHTFDQHRNTQKDLATLGKFGETVPFIPRQRGIIRNGFRILGNAGILVRNIFAPVYRFIGRTVAQPLHRVITRGRDASPYRNNPYHRFVARRDYYRDIAQQNDRANGRNHPIRNYIMSNLRSVFNFREGNKAVLNAGSYDIQNNLKEQETVKILSSFLNTKKSELESQIRLLENEISNHGDAENLNDAKTRLSQKKALLQNVNQSIDSVIKTGKIGDIQTDAVSQTQHDIASKEVNTYRVVAIKGVAAIGVKKFVGPKLKDWLIKHAQKRVKTEQPYNTTVFVEKEVKDPSKVVSITKEKPNFDIEIDDLIGKSKGKKVNLYESVSGGNYNRMNYTINGNEVCTGFHFQDGTQWGTGYSGNVPLMTDKYWPSTFLDSSNNLRSDLTFSEIAKAISDGELSNDLLNKMTIQIEGKGWVYANELFKGITKKTETGKRILEGSVHTELVPEIVQRTKTVFETVPNERIINILKGMGIAWNYSSKADGVYNVNEILRPTTSDQRSNKNNPRQYTYDDSEFYR